MRILIIGASGTIGSAVANALEGRHEIIRASRRSKHAVDITNAESIQAMYRAVGPVDAVVSVAGAGAFAPLEELTDADFQLSLSSKLMGQINLVRYGMDAVRDGGSFTLTTGNAGGVTIPGFAAIALVNGALEGFVHAAAAELRNGRRINAVSPTWVSETLAAMGQDPAAGTPATEVAKSYVRSVESAHNGTVILGNGTHV